MKRGDIERGIRSPLFEEDRLATFSDCVFAIAATVFVLDLKPPEVKNGESLLSALMSQWTHYLALLSSFVVISLIWIHHHRVFRILRRADNKLVATNLVLLLAVVFLPYPTAVLARYPDEDTAVVLYTSMLAIILVLFNLLWHFAKPHLEEDADPAYIRAMGIQYEIAAGIYLVLIVLSPLSAHAGVVGNVLAAAFLAIPPHAIRSRLSHARSASSSATP